MTEIALQEIKFDATINTSIELSNEETLNNLVVEVEKKYTDLIYTDNNEKEAKQDRAELNKVVKQIDDERKRVKREYNEPLKQFEDKMKGYSNRIAKVIEPIDDGIKDLEQRQRAERLEQVEQYILEVSSNYEIEPAELEIDSKWLNKSLSKIQRERLITDAMTLLKQQKDHKNNEINIVTSYARALDIDENAWLLQLEQGKTSVEIMKLIDESVQRKKEQEERRKQALLEQEERNEKIELERIEQEKQQSEYEKEKAELTKRSEVEEVVKTEVINNELDTIVLKFTATDEQLNLLSDFITENGILAEKL